MTTSAQGRKKLSIYRDKADTTTRENSTWSICSRPDAASALACATLARSTEPHCRQEHACNSSIECSRQGVAHVLVLAKDATCPKSPIPSTS
jgi:hypothetical protein